MLAFWKKYGKAVLSVGAAAAAAVVAAKTGDGVVSPSEWVNVLLLAAGAGAVFTAPNIPGAAYTKGILAALTAGLTVAVNLVDDGISLTDAWQIAAAVLGALGVIAAPYVPLASPGEVIGKFPESTN